jgi:hypothetical protein
MERILALIEKIILKKRIPIYDDLIHEFALVGRVLVIQPPFRHFEAIETIEKHGYLIVDGGQIVVEGSNFPVGELKKVKSFKII